MINLGYMGYTLTLNKQQFDQGIKTARNDLKVFESNINTSDEQVKKISTDVNILGGSLASMGGVAMAAGFAIGDEGMGKALITAGSGLSVVGGTLAVVTPALKSMAVVLEGTLVPALMKTAAAAYLALGPIGLLTLAVGAAAGAYLLLKATDTSSHFETQKRTIDDVYDSLDTLNQEYEKYLDLQKQLQGIPEEEGELKTGLRAAQLDLEDIEERIAAFGPGLYEKRQTLGLSAISAQDTYTKTTDPVQKAIAKSVLDQALSAVKENERDIAEFETGANTEYNRLLNQRTRITQDITKYTGKLEALPGKKAELERAALEEAGWYGMHRASLTGGELSIPPAGSTQYDFEDHLPPWLVQDWMPYSEKLRSFISWATPGGNITGGGVPTGTPYLDMGMRSSYIPGATARTGYARERMLEMPVYLTQNITVSSAEEVKTVTEGGIQLARDAGSKGVVPT